MSLPWFPFYAADYLADTGHLTVAEHGAYLMLILHYWDKGGLPDSDALVRRIARMTPEQWEESREVLAALFGPGWRHKRIDAELAEAAEKVEMRKERSRKGNAARHGSVPKSSSEDPTRIPEGSSKDPHLTSDIRKEEKAPKKAFSPSLSDTRASAPHVRVWVDMDSPQWEAWRRHRKAEGKPGTPQTTEPERGSPGWYFETEWPPGHERQEAVA